MPALRLRARWLVTLDGPSVADGALLVGADGRIAAVGPDAALPTPAGVPSLDLGDAILLPGLVNAHTHLELTALRGLVRTRPFARWVATVRRVKDALSPGDFRASARWGVLESFAAGITTTGDTGSTMEAARAMSDLGLGGVAYHEVFGPDPAQAAEALRGLESALAALAPYESARVAVGVSPHAPYTVSEPLLRAVTALAVSRGRPVAMHLAESPEETQLVREGAGPFADALRRREILVIPRHCSPVQWVIQAGLGAARALCIHAVHADDADLQALASHGMAVAHCPWSNAVLGNGRARLDAMRRHGVTVGVGTDSVAAGGGLDLFAEARHAGLATPLAPRELLGLITHAAAAALGVTDRGLLRTGAWGDVVAVATARAPLAAVEDPEEALALHATAADVVAVWVAGRPVFDRGAWPGVDAEAERAALHGAATKARRAVEARSP